ncbi:arginine--tRNA ligase [Bdellovibrio sp. HCB337]|uniref:arginine--tRNA ligase n=1 Tax=Bdellovibrio sp. HCB337 TaxID=3394358 RepID=UPI0039A5416C
MIQTAKTQIANLLNPLTQLPVEDLQKTLEKPKQFEHGHIAFPVFALAKTLRSAPPQIAADLAQKVQVKMQDGSLPFLEKVQPAGGFLNFTFKDAYLQKILFEGLQKSNVGFSGIGKDKTVVIDYASPNVAKPMHVGHLRAAMVGQAIRNLAGSQGYKVIGVNHLGDWGSQFGKLAWAYQEWGKDYTFANPMDDMVKLYVRFHDEAEKNPNLELEAAATFKRLENGDAEIKKIWQMIVEFSLKDYDRLLNGLLKVKHDAVLGESFYTDKMDAVIDLLKKKNLLKESEGAQVVFFDEKENMPPCIIKKSDGASIYATRDLATAIYRHDVMKGDELLYVVGQDQTLHFRQVFKVLELMGFEWAKTCHHISFGLYRFKEGKMSTRAGRVVLFEDVITQAIELVSKMIAEKNPNLENKETVARQVALGAVIFNDLVNDRVKNVEFDWDRILSVEGDSGPYVQYTVVRCRSILRKYGKALPAQPSMDLSMEEERKLVFQLMQFEDILTASYKQFKPNILAQYLLEVCGSFSHFYHKCRILGEAPEVESSRIAMIVATERILVQGLKILNIEAPEAM